MSKLTTATQRIWKSAQLYIGFHTDQQGNVRNQAKVWPPKNANATIHSDPKVQEVFLEVRVDDPRHSDQAATRQDRTAA
ncbi:hypothetical protein [Yoonia sp. R2-816]|uniref:hypothetical protein n=1 Tax=Yoonia sp. R2-816 TaxID=3342638 RepID=UPI00372AEEA2